MSAPGREPLAMIMTGEFSGNLYGAQVAAALKRLCPGIRLAGVGCSQMRDAGVELLYDCSSWGAVGLVEALKRPQLLWTYLELKNWIWHKRPDVVILLDYPGFNMALTRYARELGLPTVYFFPPGKHTTNPKAVARTAKEIGKVAAPLPTTFDLYKAAGGDVEFVGHPLIDMMSAVPDRAEARQLLGVDPDVQLVGVLPGSRLQEIRAHTPELLDIIAELSRIYPEMQFLLPKVRLREDFLMRKVDVLFEEIRASGLPIRIVEGQSQLVMSASDALVCASGTATIEAAYLCTPMVIVYRVSKLTEILANLFYKRFPRYIGLPNILADREIVPERFQKNFTVEEVVRLTRRYFDEPGHREKTVADLLQIRTMLGAPGAATRVAALALAEAGHPVAQAQVDAAIEAGRPRRGQAAPSDPPASAGPAIVDPSAALEGAPAFVSRPLDDELRAAEAGDDPSGDAPRPLASELA